jgi:uncharacterized protein (DUF305 family)
MFQRIRNARKGILMAALALALAGFFTGQAAASPAGQMQSDIERLKGLSGQEFETEWMSMMIQHHMGAVEMAQLVPSRANHQEIKDLAQNIIRDQNREIGEMTTWLMQWYNAPPHEGMMHEDMGMMERLQNARGDEFDRLFLQMMHDHHRGAIAMAELVSDRATHQELKSMAQNIMTSQEAEILQMMDWAMTWYNLDLMQGMMGGASGAPVGMPRTGSQNPASLLATLLAAIAALTLAGGVWTRRKASSKS